MIKTITEAKVLSRIALNEYEILCTGLATYSTYDGKSAVM